MKEVQRFLHAIVATANRKLFPAVTRMADEVRRRFPTAKLIYGVEPDGREIGSRAAHEERVGGAV